MYPLLKSGDIVIYKQIQDFYNILWGEMYLIAFDYDGQEYITVKYIKRVEEQPEMVSLVSYNSHHAPKEIPIRSIRALAMVKASIRFNGMG
jgi:phage repressor protein C with HTH and peptisase S24 domain